MNRLILAFTAVATLAGAVPLTTAAQAQVPAVRDQTQQGRIAQGVRSGQLTPGETARLEHREGRNGRMQARMHARDGAVLTPHDRRVAQRHLNRTSRAIYRAKHNGRVD
jgi:GGDEF domain-containing protein